MDFLPHTELNHSAVEAIARGLFAVAKVDGAHERELALISAFWSDTGGGAKALSDLQRREEIKPAQLASALHQPSERILFIKTALLLAHADGNVSSGERKVIGEFGRALQIDTAKIDELDASVRDFLLSQLTHVQNTDATRKVAAKLKI